MDRELAIKISRIVADCLNDGQPREASARLNALFGPEASAAEKLGALCVTPVYSLVAEKPGYDADGKPGYLPLGDDLKKAVLDEITAMIKADFDKEEHRLTWQTLQKNVEAAPEADFEPGIAVNCPDDYLLTLDKRFASELLRQYGALPDWC